MNETTECNFGNGKCGEVKVYSTHDYIGKVSDEQQARCDKFRELCRELESFLINSPILNTRSFSDRCIAMARSNLEQCCMYGIKSIVFEGKTVR